MTEPLMPNAVFVLWWIGLGVTLVIFVPLSVYLLHRTYVAARSINQYAAQSLLAAAGIAGHTPHIPPLSSPLSVRPPQRAGGGRVLGPREAGGGRYYRRTS